MHEGYKDLPLDYITEYMAGHTLYASCIEGFGGCISRCPEEFGSMV